MSKPIKIIFAGTPEFAVPYLSGFIDNPDFLVVGVITQPDKPSGRKQTLTASPIKVLAQTHGWPIFQPEKMRGDKDFFTALSEAAADLLVVVAYGQIIPADVLALFPRGAINVHPSLLPKYRGASPIQSALLSGEKETGITIMLMDDKMDHGPILAQEKHSLTGDETNESLHFSLAKSGVPLLLSTIKSYLSDEIKPRAQDDSSATYCQTITKDDGHIDWSVSAQEIKQRIHAFYPWPATWTTLEGKRLKIYPPVEVMSSDDPSPVGSIKPDNDALIIHCGKNSLRVKSLQLEGKNISDADSFIKGHKNLENHALK